MSTLTNAEKRAIEVVHRYTAIASATGAIPVPAASTAIVAENAAMIAHIASTMGTPISPSVVLQAFGIAGSLNVIGRTLFVEAARVLSAATGGVFTPGVVALGAATAGLQTYVVGLLTIEIAKNNGKPVSAAITQKVKNYAKQNYASFVKA